MHGTEDSKAEQAFQFLILFQDGHHLAAQLDANLCNHIQACVRAKAHAAIENSQGKGMP